MKSKTIFERELSIVKSENKTLKLENKKISMSITKKDTKIDSLTLLVNKTLASNEKLLKEVSSLRQDCALLNIKCNRYEKEIITLKSELSKANEKIAILETENIKLKQENKQLREENKILRNDNDRMKKILNINSENSSTPPSSDIKKNIPNNREKTNKKQGGQLGHKAHFLSKDIVQEKINTKEFEHKIINVGKVSPNYVSKYIIDIKPSVIAEEYRFYQNENGSYPIPKEFYTDVQYGSKIKSLCSILNVEGVVAIDRLTDLIKSITHGKLNIANSTIVNFVSELSNKSTNTIASIESRVLNAYLLYTDATSGRCDNVNVSVRNYSTEDITLLKVTRHKSKKALNESNILPRFTGNLVHDHETVIYNYGNKHVECNVHICRYLKGNFENTGNTWCKNLRAFLCCLNEYKKSLIAQKINELDSVALQRYSDKYDNIILKGYEQNLKVLSQCYKKEELKLLNRLKKYKENHLMFLYDFSMPFSNNLSERDLRHVKTKQKISGCFREMISMQKYLDIKSIIGTCKKQSIDFYKVISNIYDNVAIIF